MQWVCAWAIAINGFLIVLGVALAAGDALAEAKMKDDLRPDAPVAREGPKAVQKEPEGYRDRERSMRRERPQRLSDQERERLRRDILEASKDLKR